MKKIIVIFYLSMFCTTFICAQSFTNDKLSVSVDLGAGYLLVLPTCLRTA